jgi:hypothetical protein
MPENYDGCSSALPAAPSFAKIEEQYVTLMPDKVLEERPETTLAELRYLV